MVATRPVGPQEGGISPARVDREDFMGGETLGEGICKEEKSRGRVFQERGSCELSY